MKKMIFLIGVIFFTGCELQAAVNPEDVTPDVPPIWEPVSEDLARKVLKPSEFEVIVPDDFQSYRRNFNANLFGKNL